MMGLLSKSFIVGIIIIFAFAIATGRISRLGEESGIDLKISEDTFLHKVVFNSSEWILAKSLRSKGSPQPLDNYRIKCWDFRDACVDYNNQIVVFDDSYSSGILPSWISSNLFGKNAPVFNLRLSFPNGSNSDILRNPITSEGLRVKIRLATNFEDHEHLKSYGMSLKSRLKNSTTKRRGLVYSSDWIENFAHSAYAISGLLAAYDDGSLNTVFGIEGEPQDSYEPAVAIPLFDDGGKIPHYLKYLLHALPTSAVKSTSDAIKSNVGCFDSLSICSVFAMGLAHLKGAASKIYELGLTMKQIFLQLSSEALKAMPLLEDLERHNCKKGECILVTIITRKGDRSIVNIDEILDFCNNRYKPKDWVPYFIDRTVNSNLKLYCRIHDFGNNFVEDLYVANSTDIMLSVHGAALTNMIFMNPSTSVVEIFPFGAPNWMYEHYTFIGSLINRTTSAPFLRYWEIGIDSNNTFPGHFETLNIGSEKKNYPRDRKVRLSVKVVNDVFNRILSIAKYDSDNTGHLQFGQVIKNKLNVLSNS